MISAAQIRSARAHLDLSQDDVAAGAGITKYTLSNIERGATEASTKSLEMLQSYFEKRGIEFTPDYGVKMARSDVRSYEGAVGFREFMDDVYKTMKAHPGVFCVSNVDEKNWIRWLGVEGANAYCEKMIALAPRVRAHCLIREGDEMTVAAHAEYRTLPGDLFYDNTSFYVYGDRLALIRFEPENVIVRVLHNKYFTEAFKLMFYRFWDKMATRVPTVGIIPEISPVKEVALQYA